MVPNGGPMTRERRHAALLDFGDTVAALQGQYITAEDVGTSSRDMSVIAERTKYVAGLSRRLGGSGDPSPFTALGVHVAIRACCERVFESSSLRDRKICVIGLGHVGSRVAKLCAKDGAKLVVADVDRSKRRLAEELGASWTTPARALDAKVDVLAPCALGGFLDHETVPRLRCRIIAGAANNQLADGHIADLLADRQILWAPDFVVNAGGIINIVEELDEYSPANARRRVRRIAGTLGEIFDHAEKMSVTPLAAADELARERLRG
jgi:leucine dehydrogenase